MQRHLKYACASSNVIGYGVFTPNLFSPYFVKMLNSVYFSISNIAFWKDVRLSILVQDGSAAQTHFA
jgi:hypothetical protein